MEVDEEPTYAYMTLNEQPFNELNPLALFDSPMSDSYTELFKTKVNQLIFIFIGGNYLQ